MANLDPDSPVPVQVLSEFVDDYVQEKGSGDLTSNQIQLIQSTLSHTFNDDFRGLNFKELQEALALYKKEKRMIFKRKPTDSESEAVGEGQSAREIDCSDPESHDRDSRRSSSSDGASSSPDEKVSNQHPVQRPQAWNPVSEAQRSLHAQMEEETVLLNQGIDDVTNAKYFGDQGRARFFNRYHWLSSKISKLNAESSARTEQIWRFDEDTAACDGEIDDRLLLLDNGSEVREPPVDVAPGSVSPLPPAGAGAGAGAGSRFGVLCSDDETHMSVPVSVSATPPRQERSSKFASGPSPRTRLHGDPHTDTNMEGGVQSMLPVVTRIDTSLMGIAGLSVEEARGDEVRVGTDTSSAEEFSSPASYRPMTARTAYLEGCIRENVVPRAVIIRRNITNRLNLSHQGLGDSKATIVAESLVTLPHVRSVNFASNSLTDSGVCKIMRQLQSFTGLLELDLSNNIIGM